MNEKVRRGLRVLVLVPVAVVLLALLWLPFRPNTLRDQPAIVAGTGPTDLPADVAALRLFPQYLRGIDLSPGAYAMENTSLYANWIRDNVVQDSGGLAKIPFHPDGILPLKDLAIIKGFMNLVLLHDGDGAIVGIGSQVENLTLDSRPPPTGNTVFANTDWTLFFPGRGILFLGQKEGGPDIPNRNIQADKSGQPWVGTDEFNHTVGPLPPSIPGARDARGIVHGGTGEFAGVVGSFREINLLFSVPPSGKGDTDGATRIEMSYLKPNQPRPTTDTEGKDVPEEIARWGLPASTLTRIDFKRPHRTSVRDLHFKFPDDVIYFTHGVDAMSPTPPVPPSMGILTAPLLSRTQTLMVRVRDRSDEVVGLAGAFIEDAQASWTITLPGEGTLHVTSSTPAQGWAGTGVGVLRGQRGIVLDGTGIFATAAGYLMEAPGPESGTTTLSISTVAN